MIVVNGFVYKGIGDGLDAKGDKFKAYEFINKTSEPYTVWRIDLDIIKNIPDLLKFLEEESQRIIKEHNNNG